MILSDTTHIDPDVYRAGGVLFLTVVVLYFLVTMVKLILDHRLKNKMIQKDISEELVASILQKDTQGLKHQSIKWFLVAAATGIGLFLTHAFLPLGLHSIGIMAISIAMAFLLYTGYLLRYGH